MTERFCEHDEHCDGEPLTEQEQEALCQQANPYAGSNLKRQRDPRIQQLIQEAHPVCAELVEHYRKFGVPDRNFSALTKQWRKCCAECLRQSKAAN